MKIEVNIVKKHLYIVMAVAVVLVGIVLVIAGTGAPSGSSTHPTLYADTIESATAQPGVTIDDNVGIGTVPDTNYKLTTPGPISTGVGDTAGAIRIHPGDGFDDTRRRRQG